MNTALSVFSLMDSVSFTVGLQHGGTSDNMFSAFFLHALPSFLDNYICSAMFLIFSVSIVDTCVLLRLPGAIVEDMLSVLLPNVPCLS
jgi:hypothetical protein